MDSVLDQGGVNGKHDDVTRIVIGVFFDVYNEMGFGFLESVYKESMRLALEEKGLKALAEVPISVHFRGKLVGIFRADLVVNDVVLIELKVCDGLSKQHESQTLHYLRATNLEVALLMNFGPSARFKRLVMDNEKKPERSAPSAKIGVKPSAGEGHEV